jgi:Predicted metal-binding protein (DUF2103)
VTGRHRIKGVKREHSVITGLLPVLERIAANQLVAGVIPGRISVTRGATTSLQLRVGPRTVTGIKLTARRATVAQEVFVMTSDVGAFLVYLRDKIPEFAE